MSVFAKDIASSRAHEPKRIVLIDGSRHADEIESEIWENLCSRFANLTPVLAKMNETAIRRETDPTLSRFGGFQNALAAGRRRWCDHPF